MKKILVGTDGSLPSSAAVEFAAGLARATGATLHLACSIEPAMLYGADTTGEVVAIQYESARNAAARTLNDAVALLAKEGVAANTIQMEGPPAEALALIAKDEQFDLVVVGHRGRGAIARVLLGSVANQLVEICTRPVLVHR